MTPTLRKIHRLTWFSLALLLPLGWLAAIVVIPGEVVQTPVRAEEAAPLPLVAQSVESDDFVIRLRQDSTGDERQIEIFIKKPLETPNTTVVTESGTVLGLLGARGIRRFHLDSLSARSKPLRIRFEDRIKGRTLRIITFE